MAKYKRILLKLSGESLMGEKQYGIDEKRLDVYKRQLLFILIFIIAIFVFGLSIIGFILRTIFGLGRGSSSSRPKQTEAGRTCLLYTSRCV